MATLMLVDDEPSILEVYKDVLEIRHHVVICEARDGEEAVSLYKKLEEKPDLVLMDHRMPRSDGITAMRNIHLLNPLQPIVFVTADYEAAKYVMDIGAHSFLLKPFRMDALFGAIEVALADVVIKKNQIREAFLGLVTQLEPDDPERLQIISDRLERDVIDRFIPGKEGITLTIETMANWLCRFFNLMGMDYSYSTSGEGVHFKNTKCPWKDRLGSNPRFCFAARFVISRFAARTGMRFTLDSHSSIMAGDKDCSFELRFEG